MDAFLDILWLKIVDVVQILVRGMDAVVAPVNALGPAAVIFLLTFLTVCLTKLFKRVYTTKRFQILKKDFEHWSELRKETMNIEDPETGKRMARNIDQAKLNKVYYDYFFEGLLNSVLTTVLPILLMAAYVNEAYNPEKLQKLFGRSYVFGIPGTGDDPILVSALFWYVLCLIIIHVLWAVAKRILNKKNVPDNSEIENRCKQE